MKLKGVLQQFSPASGNRTLLFVFRTTMKDGQSGDMTIVELPINIIWSAVMDPDDATFTNARLFMP
jgi:hypothetical protein